MSLLNLQQKVKKMKSKKELKSLSLKPEQIKFLINILKKNGIELSKSENEKELCRISQNDIFLIVYNTGTIVFKESEITSKIIGELKDRIPKSYKEFDYYIGSDETGKGEWYGPLVTVAVCLKPKDLIKYQFEGFKDSKSLTRRTIFDLFSKLENLVKRKSLILNPEKLSQMWIEFSNEGKNYNDILAWTHARVIFDILDNLDTENNKIRVVIDKFDFLKLDNRLRKYQKNPNIKIIQKSKGESEVEVAVASVIAKKVFEEIIEQYNNEYNIDIKKSKLENISLDILSKISKLFFKNVQARFLDGILDKYMDNREKLFPNSKQILKVKSKEDFLKALKNEFEDELSDKTFRNIMELFKNQIKSSEIDHKNTQGLEDLLHRKEIILKEKETKIQELHKGLKKKQEIIDEIKGPKLEQDSRIMCERIFKYEMNHDSYNVNISDDECALLYSHICIKDKSTKSIEIDLYGEKRKNGIPYYCLGECKYINKKMSKEDYKCFILKASILANYLIYEFKRTSRKL